MGGRAKQRDRGSKQGHPRGMVKLLQAIRVIYSEELMTTVLILSFCWVDHLPNLQVLGLEPQHPVIEHVAFLLVERDLPVLVQVLIIVGHLREVDRGIVASELMVSASDSVEIRGTDIEDHSLQRHVDSFVDHSIMLPQLLVGKIGGLRFEPRRGRIEGGFFVGLVDEEENRDDEDSQDDQPLTHDNLYK